MQKKGSGTPIWLLRKGGTVVITGVTMSKPKKNSVKSQHVQIPLTKQDLPIEVLKQLIEQNLINDELPFELLAEQYPSLLEEWYPGYPGMPRMMTTDDPICVLGSIKNGTVSFKEMPELGDISLGGDVDPPLEGDHKVWLQSKNGSWVIYVVSDDTSP